MAKATFTAKTLGTFSIWAIGVGLVISGESFGWNNGWAYMGPAGFLIPVGIVSLMYFFLVKSLTELAVVYPNAEAPHTYAEKAFGPRFGDFVAVAILIEFLFAMPAIANAIGQYLHFLAPTVFDAKTTALLLLVVFCLLNLVKINFSVMLVIVLTLLAIAELFIFSTAVLPTIKPSHFVNSGYDNYSFAAVMKSMPYAIWMFLGIEGISLLTKNIKSKGFAKSISRGYMLSFFTILILVLLVLFFAGSAVNWDAATWAGMVTANDHPLPYAMNLSLGQLNPYVQIFTFLGLFGLFASLQGISLASINQVNYLLSAWVKPASNFRRPVILLVVMSVGILSILYESTGLLIEISVFGAVCLYFTSCISLLKLRNMNVEDTALSQMDGKVITTHGQFNGFMSNLAAFSVIIISAFSLVALGLAHKEYLLAFCIISAGYVVLNAQQRKRRLRLSQVLDTISKEGETSFRRNNRYQEIKKP